MLIPGTWPIGPFEEENRRVVAEGAPPRGSVLSITKASLGRVVPGGSVLPGDGPAS